MFMIPIKIYNFHTEHRTSIHDFEKLVIAVARAFRVSHINCFGENAIFHFWENMQPRILRVLINTIYKIISHNSSFASIHDSNKEFLWVSLLISGKFVQGNNEYLSKQNSTQNNWLF